MGDTYPCLSSGCGKVFSKAFELKKHKATHEDPDRVFHCPDCDFITLQKKNLRIHRATHTGEKCHRCPQMIESPVGEERCQYRTNDPAALTKHRKRVHAYIPPPSRSWPRKATPAASRRPQLKKDRRVLRRHHPYRHPLPVSCQKPSLPIEGAVIASSCTGDWSASTTAPEGFAPSWRGNSEGQQQTVDHCSSSTSAYNPPLSSNAATLVPPVEEMDLNALYDPSLQPEWMAMYEMSYSMFDETGMRYLPQPLHEASPVDPAGLCARTSLDGCLCPEWMVDAGIEGWDQSVLDTH